MIEQALEEKLLHGLEIIKQQFANELIKHQELKYEMQNQQEYIKSDSWHERVLKDFVGVEEDEIELIMYVVVRNEMEHVQERLYEILESLQEVEQ
jgi:hypothetical protein